MQDRERQELAQSYFERAYAAQMQGELASAAELYQRSIDLYPTAEAHTFLGWTYSFIGRYDDAIAECRKAIAIDPEFGNPWNDIGAYYIEKGQLQQAIPYLERAITAQRYESRAYPHMNLGRLWERAGVYYKALAEYRQAAAASPDYDSAARALTRVQRMLQN